MKALTICVVFALIAVALANQQSRVSTLKTQLHKAKIHTGKSTDDDCWDEDDSHHVHHGNEHDHEHDEHLPKPCMVEPEYAEPPSPITDLSDLSELTSHSQIEDARAHGRIAPWIQQVPVNIVAYSNHPVDPHPVFPTDAGCQGDGCSPNDHVHPEYVSMHPPVGLKHTTNSLFDPQYVAPGDSLATSDSGSDDSASTEGTVA